MSSRLRLSLEDRVKARLRHQMTAESIQILKHVYNSGVATALGVRSSFLSAGGSEAGRPVNLYHGSIQKTGSTWLSALLSDKRICRHTGMRTFPQFRYEWGDFRKKFPKFTYVPGLYIPYGLYEEIKKPKNFATIYVVRDPRDVLVSWYYSTRDTHALMGKVGKDRVVLRKLDFDDGIRYSIEQLQLKFAFMRSWVYAAKTDSHLSIYKFESLTANPNKVLLDFFDSISISIPAEILHEVVKDYTFERMRERDIALRHRVNGSHYRIDKKPWEEVLSASVLEYFYKNIGDLVELLEYN